MAGSGKLIYGKSGKLIYGKSGKLLYADKLVITTTDYKLYRIENVYDQSMSGGVSNLVETTDIVATTTKCYLNHYPSGRIDVRPNYECLKCEDWPTLFVFDLANPTVRPPQPSAVKSIYPVTYDASTNMWYSEANPTQSALSFSQSQKVIDNITYLGWVTSVSYKGDTQMFDGISNVQITI